MVNCWSQARDYVDGSLLEPLAMDCWCRSGDNVDGTSLEPYMTSVVHHWSQ